MDPNVCAVRIMRASDEIISREGYSRGATLLAEEVQGAFHDASRQKFLDLKGLAEEVAEEAEGNEHRAWELMLADSILGLCAWLRRDGFEPDWRKALESISR